MQKNNKRTSKMESDDSRRETVNNIVPEKPLEIVSLSIDNKSNIFGLGNNGKVYRYVLDNREWVLV